MTMLPKPYYEDQFVRLFHGDAFKLLRRIVAAAGEFTVITDPPYGTGWITGEPSKAGIFVADGVRPDWDVWNTKWLRFTDDAKACAIFAPDHRLAELFKWYGTGRLRYYVKSNTRPALNGNDAPSVEPIFITPRVRFSKRPAHLEAYNGDAEHPCQKPVSVMTWLVEDVAGIHETVIDPFAGSGTTLVAAKALGRRAIGIEQSLEFCEMAARRLRQEMLPGTQPVVPVQTELC